MPRTARMVIPGMALHVRHRGHNRSACFFGPEDYTLYLGLLARSAQEHGCAVHAYCLMPNHVHLLVTPATESGLAQTMKCVAQHYAQHVNKAYVRTGSLWEGRYRSCLVPTPGYILACYRYIELNPVAAGMIDHPRAYRWSSYRENIGDVRGSFVKAHPAFPGSDAYRGLFAEELAPQIVDDFRRATAGGYAVGMARRKRGRQMRKIGTVPI
jgi:putative transposase